MSSIEEINMKLAEIGAATSPGAIRNVDGVAWAIFTMRADGSGEVRIINADPAAYPEQGDILDPIYVGHHGAASITLRGDASTTEAVFGLLERALTFVSAQSEHVSA